jgi:hypothetical protein
VRKVVAPKIELRFNEILDEQKILLVKLSHGLLGEENSTLLGTLIVSKLHQGAMARQSQRANQRTPFFLYIDEFQNFITPSLMGVLSGARKYGLGLILAHQELRQIFDQDSGVGNSVIANPCTRICFRLGDFDAQKLQEGFVHFTSQDLQNLGLGETIARVEKSEDDFNLNILSPKMVNVETAKSRRKRVIKLSHEEHLSVESFEDQELAEEEDVYLPDNITRQPLNTAERKSSAEKPPVKQETFSHGGQSTILSEPSEEKTLSQHRYLQTLIKHMAEERGYRAVIEEPTSDGLGRVDVGLTRNDEKIACEISVTTNDEHELQNIQKCLKSGYQKIIICAPDKRRLIKIEALVKQNLNEVDQTKVLFFEPDSLFLFFQEQKIESSHKEERVKGYRVKVRYQDVHEKEQTQIRDSISKVILQSIKRMNKTEN